MGRVEYQSAADIPIAWQHRLRAAPIPLAVIPILLAVVNVATGNWLGLITNVCLVGLVFVNRESIGRNIRVAEQNAVLRQKLSPSETRERELRIAKLERDLGIVGEVPHDSR